MLMAAWRRRCWRQQGVEEWIAMNILMQARERERKRKRNEIVKCTLNMGNSPLYAHTKIADGFFIASKQTQHGMPCRVLHVYVCMGSLTCVFFPLLFLFFRRFLVLIVSGAFLVEKRNKIHKHKHSAIPYSHLTALLNGCAFNWI